jgi:hypothetical protein
MTEKAKGPISWSALLLYVLVLPAAMQLLSRLDEYFEFSGLIGRLLRLWENFIHGLWERLLALLPQWIELGANQIDALTWCVAMIGAVVFAPDADEPERRASPLQTAVLFWLSFACVSAIFLTPYFPAKAHAFELEAARVGFLGAVRVVFLDVLLWLGVAGVMTYHVLEYRKRNAGREMVPLGQHLEQAIGVMVIGGLTGVLLGGSENASVAAMDQMAAQLTGEFSFPVLWERLIEPTLFAIVFCVTLIEVRRNNWASMPRMIAATAGVFIADRLIVLTQPWWGG